MLAVMAIRRVVGDRGRGDCDCGRRRTLVVAVG